MLDRRLCNSYFDISVVTMTQCDREETAYLYYTEHIIAGRRRRYT